MTPPEQHLVETLFDRTRRSVTLTAAGRSLQEHARAATQELTRGVMEARRIASGDSGKLVVGTPPEPGGQRIPNARLERLAASTQESS